MLSKIVIVYYILHIIFNLIFLIKVKSLTKINLIFLIFGFPLFIITIILYIIFWIYEKIFLDLFEK